MPSEAQRRADRKYKRDKTRQFCLRFYPAEAEIWMFLSTQENKQGFLKELISREMKLTSGGNAAALHSRNAHGLEPDPLRCGAPTDDPACTGGLGVDERTDSQ